MTGGILLAVAILTSLGEVKVKCADPGDWTFALDSSGQTGGVETVRVTLKTEREAPPPKFSVGWFVSQRDTHHFWTSSSTHYGIPWSVPSVSELTSDLPVYAFMGVNDENRFTFACSESCRRVVFRSPVDEVRQGFNCSFEFFSVPEAPIGSYAVEIRLDPRRISYAQTIGEAADWIARSAGIRPMAVPDAAFDALYSTWYTFHQDVSAELVENECRLAAQLGLKSVIVDDGWQIDLPLGGRAWGGYRRCGDWKAGRNFPDMAAHVRRVHDLGLNYLLWYSVPFVGEESANFARFKGKFLPVSCAGGWVLDPRFPEVREFIVGTYEQALRDWDLDGFKLDFIGRFTLKDGVVDPAIAENYAGRDIKSIPLAVDALLTTVKERLSALKPGILIEFRQPYIGPSIRRFGNMLRANDCPLSMVENRTRIVRIRLTAGQTAVHSDMLQWRTDETPENAALAILNSIFGVIQYSVRLKTLPESHRRMMAHWLGFAAQHKEALVKGAFRPHLPASDYPLLEGESATERVIGVYQKDLVVTPGDAGKPVYVLNGTPGERVLVDLPVGYAVAEVFDTFGVLIRTEALATAGLRSFSVPPAGYVKLK